MLLSLPWSPTPRFFVEPGSGKAVVRVFWIAEASGRRCCIDSKPIDRRAAIKMARAIVQAGDECEVLAWRGNMCRPPDYRVHRVRNLSDAPVLIVEALETKPALPPQEQVGLF